MDEAKFLKHLQKWTENTFGSQMLLLSDTNIKFYLSEINDGKYCDGENYLKCETWKTHKRGCADCLKYNGN